VNVLVDKWAFAPTEELLAMVGRHWGKNSVSLLSGTTVIDSSWECPALRAWMDYATGLLVPLSPQGGKVITFAVKNPVTDEEWAPGYPHSHAYAYHALVHYLDPGGDAKPLIVWNDDDTLRELACVAGQTYVLEGNQKHGVLGSSNPHQRIALGMISMPSNVQTSQPEEGQAA
jgi:hypothetical protein